MSGEDLIAAVRIHFQGWSRARMHLPRDFRTHALVGSGEISLSPRRRAAEEQSSGANDEDSNKTVKYLVMISHSGPLVTGTALSRIVAASNLGRIRLETMQALCHKSNQLTG